MTASSRKPASHAELLARGGTYAHLYELQFADSDAAPSAAGPRQP